ncbi:hypothetical protein [Isoptericola aurantiacus]|uniref:hypothetical protein n=1 Tax=Isoptericola aurantiacus TaxID=3377839 RepID=UPI003839D012
MTTTDPIDRAAEAVKVVIGTASPTMPVITLNDWDLSAANEIIAQVQGNPDSLVYIPGEGLRTYIAARHIVRIDVVGGAS